MRLAMIAALVAVAVVGCSAGSGDCFPSTCPDGCCGADGMCHAGTEASACGSRANSCVDCAAAGQFCGADQFCHAPSVGADAGSGADAGMDAGVDAGVQVFVTFRHDMQKQVFGGCPPEFAVETCSNVKAMSPEAFSALRLEYPECDVTQTDEQGYLIDCTGNCTARTMSCKSSSSGLSEEYTDYACTTPAHAFGMCLWDPESP